MAFQIGDNRKVVTTAGTAEALEASFHEVQWVIIQAETDNTGIIAVGASTVVAAQGTQRGMTLFAGESTPPLPLVDLNKLYINATVSGDGVNYVYLG